MNLQGKSRFNASVFSSWALAFSLAACSKGSAVSASGTAENTEELFRGTVISISDDGIMLVLPEEGSEAANSSDRFNISVEYLLDSSPEPAVGDVIEVVYSGRIEELYPAQLAGITSVEVIKEMQGMWQWKS